MKLSDYSIGNIVCFVVRILLIMGLVLGIKPLAIIPAVICVVLTILCILAKVGLSKGSCMASIVIMICVILASLYGDVKVRGIAALLPLSDTIAIMYSQWKGKYYGETLEDLERGNF